MANWALFPPPAASRKTSSPWAPASRDLLRLRPVTFRYKKPYADGSKPVQYGLIAEEVSEVYPDLVARSADGQIESVKYQVLDSMLLNEVQRQQVEITTQKSQIQRLASISTRNNSVTGMACWV